MMNKNTLFASLLAGISLAAVGGPLDKAWIKGVTDKCPVAYKVGEEMTLTLTLEGVEGELPAGYRLDWTRTGDDSAKTNGVFDLAKGPFVLKSKIACPGFVRFYALVKDAKGQPYRKVFTGDTTTPEGKKAANDFERQPKVVFFDGGAGFDIEKLTSHPEPQDFDAFWAKQAARLDKVPVKADTIEIPCANPKARLYAVRIDCAGLRPVTGYLSVPKAATDEGKTFPARLETHGYSGDRCTHGRPTWSRDNEIVLNINAHGLKLAEFGATEADTKALRWETRSHDCSYAFDPKQNADAETAYFNGMVLRVKRGLQYLKTVKGWNGRDLLASGGSQGGLQTIWAAGCGEGVTRAESSITWCCDLYSNGLRKQGKMTGDGWYIPWTEALGYYDPVNFAKRIPKTCLTIIPRAGIGDYCCPPEGLAKLYNNMTCPKKIVWVQGSQHGYVPPVNYPGRDWTFEANARGE